MGTCGEVQDRESKMLNSILGSPTESLYELYKSFNLFYFPNCKIGIATLFISQACCEN